MNFNDVNRILERGKISVGADLSCPSPLDQPRDPAAYLDTFLKSHYRDPTEVAFQPSSSHLYYRIPTYTLRDQVSPTR